MFLSVVIPIYNDEMYLAECLDSCLDQDYSQDDYEIICVDDGSTDRTPEMLREYEEKYPNIRVIFKEHGVGGGRTVGFTAAKGDYIWFVDHDDIVEKNAVGELKAFAERNPLSERITFPYYQFFNELTEKERMLKQQGKLTPNDDNRYGNFVVWNCIFKRQFLVDHDITPSSKRVREAGTYWGISKFYAYSGDTIFVDECIDKGIRSISMDCRPFYYYRRHDNSESIDYSKKATDKKMHLKYHRALVFLYLAIQKKEIYMQQRREHGSADADATVKAVMSARSAFGDLAGLPGKYWRQGMKRAKEKDAFFPLKIEEYTFTYRQFMKTRPLRERLTPSVSATYFSYSELGARLLRITRIFGVFGKTNAFTRKVHMRNLKRHNLKTGTNHSK